jgi:hypothetical protein
MMRSLSILQLLAGVGTLWIILVVFFYPKPDQIVSISDVLFQANHGEFFELERKKNELQVVKGAAVNDAKAEALIDELMQEEEVKPKLNEVTTPRKRKRIKISTPPNIFHNNSVGEYGIGWTLPQNLPEKIKKLFDDGWKNHQFNQYLSDIISVRRKLKDFRNAHCMAAASNYSETLPKTSVIIIFHNEAWSTLLRSVHSVLDRSPEHLIEEILLVDDFSDMGRFQKR